MKIRGGRVNVYWVIFSWWGEANFWPVEGFSLILPVGKTPLTYVTLPKYSPITDAFLKMVKNEVSGLLSLSVLVFLRIAS